MFLNINYIVLRLAGAQPTGFDAAVLWLARAQCPHCSQSTPTAAKDTIKNQLDILARKLQAAKETWKERQEVTLSSRPTECTLQYSTGQ